MSSGTNRRKPHVVIVGAGPGGLTTAMILSARGVKVTVVEKASKVGGRNSELKVGPYSFDTGPTFLHQKFTLAEMFSEAGRDLDSELEFVRLDPMTRLSWGATSLNTSSDPSKMSREIERVFPGESEGFGRFMQDHGKKLRLLYPCLQAPYHQWWDLLKPQVLRAFPYVATRENVFSLLRHYFRDERLRLAFTFQSKYLGMSPWKCPSLFSILAYTEYKFGVHHVKGGLFQISEKMAELAAENGAEIRLDSPVAKVVTEGKRKAKAVQLASGEVIKADAVVVNADYGHAATRLLNGAGVPDQRMRKKGFSCSTFMLYLGLDKTYRDQPHHHILFADDYRKNVNEVQDERVPSRDMSIYLQNAGATDDTLAPNGRSGLYVLVPTVNLRHGVEWSEIQEEYRERVLDRIELTTGMHDLRSHIVEEKMITPERWEEDYSVYLGATFNLKHTLNQLLYLRPHNRYGKFHNLYLAGGGTHPGSGLPTIYESGRIASNLVCEQFGISYKSVDLASGYVGENVEPGQSKASDRSPIPV